MMNDLFSHVERISATQQVADMIKKLIMEGKVERGSKLPSERLLAAQLGVSRPALREALVMLSSYGLIETRQGEGNFVVDKFSESVFSFMGFDDHLNKNNYRYFFQVRRVIEAGIVKDAIKNVSTAKIEHLRKINSVFSNGSAKNYSEVIDAEIQFHDTLVSLAENPLMLELYRMIFKLFKSSASYVLNSVPVLEETITTHAAIVDALEAHDYERCLEAVNSHLDISLKNLRHYFDKNP